MRPGSISRVSRWPVGSQSSSPSSRKGSSMGSSADCRREARCVGKLRPGSSARRSGGRGAAGSPERPRQRARPSTSRAGVSCRFFRKREQGCYRASGSVLAGFGRQAIKAERSAVADAAIEREAGNEAEPLVGHFVAAGDRKLVGPVVEHGPGRVVDRHGEKLGPLAGWSSQPFASDWRVVGSIPATSKRTLARFSPWPGTSWIDGMACDGPILGRRLPSEGRRSRPPRSMAVVRQVIVQRKRA